MEKNILQKVSTVKESAWPLISTERYRTKQTSSKVQGDDSSGGQHGVRERMASHVYRTKQTSSHVRVNIFGGSAQ